MIMAFTADTVLKKSSLTKYLVSTDEHTQLILHKLASCLKLTHIKSRIGNNCEPNISNGTIEDNRLCIFNPMSHKDFDGF